MMWRCLISGKSGRHMEVDDMDEGNVRQEGGWHVDGVVWSGMKWRRLRDVVELSGRREGCMWMEMR